ncbi:hypothetical protein S7711_11207 [Stachybotrys chartarum IBT 7711]|uniref:Uncharacterized protein n=1 Tax=Stachybotrys chartarum (strain CBS 109288 / IBT 7711) TaxID=1280523 RepID=A0A084AFC9_STACB|nr:hypothetical protein S7711_11207 [Stachybotrys chartarum IBT 7711]
MIQGSQSVTHHRTAQVLQTLNMTASQTVPPVGLFVSLATYETLRNAGLSLRNHGHWPQKDQEQRQDLPSQSLAYVIHRK